MPKKKWLKIWENAQESEILRRAREFQDKMKMKNYSKKTVETMKSRLSCFLCWLKNHGIEKIQDILEETIREYQKYLCTLKSENTGKPFCTMGQSRYMHAACLFLRFLTREGYLLSDVTGHIHIPKRIKKSLPKVISHKDIENIINQADVSSALGIRDRAIMEILYSCGLRRSELGNLRLQDVDMDAGTVLVRQGKGGKPRLLPLGERAALWVTKYIHEVRGIRLRNGEGSLFLNHKGKPMTTGQMALRIKLYIRSAGIREGNCHIFRHAMATQMLENGADIRYIQEMLGHEQITTTEIYTKVSIRRLKEVHSQTHPGDNISLQVPEKPYVIADETSNESYPKIPRNQEVSRSEVSSEKFWKEKKQDGTLRDLGNCFIEDLLLKGYKEETATGHRRRVKFFLLWCEERNIKTPGELSKGLILRYQNHLLSLCKGSGLPLSARYQALNITSLGLFFQWLEEKNHIIVNLSLCLEMPRLPKQIPIQILTMQEIKAVFSQADIRTPIGIRNRAILETFYSTGIRRSEMMHLKIEDVSFEQASVRVVKGKGGKDRVVPIGKAALGWIERYISQVRCLWAQEEEKNLFLTHQGKYLSKWQMNTIVTEAIRAAKIPKKGSCHILRHAMATHMLENGADIRYIQEILGHESLASTQIYTKVSIRKLKEVHTQTHPARLKPNKK